MTTLKTISEKVNAWRRYREAVRELSQLTDRELSDIGPRRHRGRRSPFGHERSGLSGTTIS